MGFLVTIAFGGVYFGIALVLPIWLASGYLVRRGRPAWWSFMVVLGSVLMALAGFFVAIVYAARATPPSHDLLNPIGGIGAALLAFVVGMPIGGWMGAWGTALLLRPSKS